MTLRNSYAVRCGAVAAMLWFTAGFSQLLLLRWCGGLLGAAILTSLLAAAVGERVGEYAYKNWIWTTGTLPLHHHGVQTKVVFAQPEPPQAPRILAFIDAAIAFLVDHPEQMPQESLELLLYQRSHPLTAGSAASSPGPKAATAAALPSVPAAPKPTGPRCVNCQAAATQWPSLEENGIALPVPYCDHCASLLDPASIVSPSVAAATAQAEPALA